MAAKNSHFVIAIDGPAGSGKSTVSKLVARELGLIYIDTGAMYRALTLKAMRAGADLENEAELTALARSTVITLDESGGKQSVMLDGEDVACLIRTPELTGKVKYIARVPGVREEMVRLQRLIGLKRGATLEGRDIGTVVFPDAKYKFYLDADPAERARRRHKELSDSGVAADLQQIKNDVIARDRSDMNRSVGALKQAPDAVRIDTTKLSIGEVVGKILAYVGKAG